MKCPTTTCGVSSNGEIETYRAPENDPGNIVLASTRRRVQSTWDRLIPGFYTLFAEALSLLFYDRTAGLPQAGTEEASVAPEAAARKEPKLELDGVVFKQLEVLERTPRGSERHVGSW
ncbi:hypothetical protein [Archangium lansingense]|uniref:Uncharacterized protein n=1 Tax=Archangium lansingense TaxID=2995310 RepID=A0ABT4AQ21_9BACT|nr:hypothetical protein [Archangium lansinium]MCY1083711.1 hypothetical protein [Archangium lansinium]